MSALDFNEEILKRVSQTMSALDFNEEIPKKSVHKLIER